MSKKILIRGVSAVLLLATIGIFVWVQLNPPKTVVYYGQADQDYWVMEEVFPDVDDGFFVDIGAWDGKLLSNTKALEDRGWNGICVEPFPQNWEGRKCQLFKEVAYDKAGEKIEFRTAGVLGGIDEHIEAHKERVKKESVIELETTTIGDILERGNAPDYIHYLSIDTEGSEYEILSVFPFEKHRVGAFTIEHNKEADKRKKLLKLLTDNGYVRVKEGKIDDYYLDAKLAE